MRSCQLTELRSFSETDTLFRFMQSFTEGFYNEAKLSDKIFAILILMDMTVSLSQRDEKVYSISRRQLRNNLILLCSSVFHRIDFI